MSSNVGTNSKLRKQLKRKSDVVFIVIFVIAMMVVATALDSVFMTPDNLLNLVAMSTPVILAAFGQTLVILLGGIDLTVGPVISLSTVIMAAIATPEPGGWILPFAIAIGAGAIIGFANGMIVTKGKQQPIIVTLAMSAIVEGVALAIQPNAGVVMKNAKFCSFFSGMTASAFPSILIIVITAILWVVLNKTSFGRNIFATGGNEASAVASGIQVDKVKIKVFVLAGLFAALAGIYVSAMMNAGDPLAGAQYTMRTITAVVIGGTHLAGGKGGILGTIAGVFIIMIINNVLNFIGVSTFYQYILQGAILLIALTINAVKAMR